jgi:hypothetical protein
MKGIMQIMGSKYSSPPPLFVSGEDLSIFGLTHSMIYDKAFERG